MNRVLQTIGDGYFFETEYETPPLKSDDILVRAIMTGVCRSDIDMMQGNFGPLPVSMQGHEGLGEVIAAGADAYAKPGDIVATRGEPAYADEYVCGNHMYVVVPEVHEKYILEPVACAVNIVRQAEEEIQRRDGGRLAILGTGFLARVAHQMLVDYAGYEFDIDVVGNYNADYWGDLFRKEPEGEYDVVIDLSNHNWVFERDMFTADPLVIMATQKEVTTNFETLLWKAATMVFPSPRHPEFIFQMQLARDLIEQGYIDVSGIWTRGYDRDTEWQQAFEDGLKRPAGYSRGYIEWR